MSCGFLVVDAGQVLPETRLSSPHNRNRGRGRRHSFASWRCPTPTPIIPNVTTSTIEVPIRLATTSGEQPSEGGDHGAVGPIESRLGCASLQHGRLMAQDEDLDLVGGVAADIQHHPARQLREHMVDQLQRRRRIMPAPPGAKQQFSGGARGFGYPHLLGTDVVRGGQSQDRFTDVRHVRAAGPIDGSAEGVAGWPDRCLGSRRRAVGRSGDAHRA